jgi:MoaD family protein
MRFRVKGFLTLKSVMGNYAALEMEMGEATVREVLVALSEKFGKRFRDQIFDAKTGELMEGNQILINGRHYRHLPGQLDASIKDGDELALFPPLLGG